MQNLYTSQSTITANYMMHIYKDIRDKSLGLNIGVLHDVDVRC